MREQITNMQNDIVEGIDKTAKILTGNIEFHDKLMDFAIDLSKKYPNANDYRLYHVLLQSSPPDGYDFPKFDFPGDDSILKFLKSKKAEFDHKHSMDD